ncbi:MAG: ABC transporter ATP-binding protein [Actinomycetaceae bacterium]|nr:ABC transporter ATP-binding protein [Actinomycetaceae bacterium]
MQITDVHRTVILPNGAPLPILRGVDLTVNAGEHVAIVGQSGTGKSTLLNIIGMLDLPDHGTYLFNDQPVAELSESARAHLRGQSFGFVFQQFNLFGSRTALNNVTVPLMYSSGTQFLKRNQLAAAMLERVGLGDRLDAMPNQLSGGEQQRVAIARALVRRPKVILADEPTGALDPNTGKLVMELLEEVARENQAALIVITHDMAVAARSQTVYEIAEGVLHPRSKQSLVALTANHGFPAAALASDEDEAPAAASAPSPTIEGGADIG